MNPGDEPWTGSKKQKAALREKYDGRCAYCGSELKNMHADHLRPVTRITTDPWSKPLPAAERYLINPENNVVSNMMPACAPCNLHKGGYSLEGWRDMIQRSAEIVAREKSAFRAGVRFGLIEVKSGPVVFYFERQEGGEA
jgi:hypothetical protein